MTRLVAAVLPPRGSGGVDDRRSSRCSGTSTTPPPARPRRCCCRSAATARGRATTTTVVAPALLARLQPSGWSAGLSRWRSSAATRGAATPSCSRCSGTSPARAADDDRAGAALLLAPRPRRLRVRPDCRCCSWAATDGDSYAIQFPLFWHFASERRRDLHDRHAARLLPHATATAGAWASGRSCPCCSRARARQRSHFALVPLFWHFARPRPPTSSTTVVGPYCTGAGAARPPTPSSRCLLPARRAAGRQRRDQLHALPAGPLPARREHAACSSTPLGGVGARAEPQRRLRSAPTSGTTTRSCRSASSRSCTPTSRTATPASGPASTAPGSRSTRPTAGRASCSRCSAPTRTSTSATPGWSPPSSACAGTTAIASTPSCRSTGGRCSAIDDTTVVGPLLRPHRARACTTSASCRSSSTRATRSGRVTVIPPLLYLPRATSTTARASGTGASSTSTSTTATRA